MKDATILQTERNYGIDLLRIVSMFMVCLLHVIGRGGILDVTEPQSVNYYFAWLIEIAAFCAVNCYALISGYVGVKSKYKVSNILYLWLQVAIYSVAISVVFAIIKPDTYTWKTILKSFLPVTFSQYWYFTAYFGLFLFIPILNFALNNMPRNVLKYILLSLSIIITVFSRLRADLFTLNDGYSALWLIVLYFIGGYIKIYEPFNNIKSKWLILSWFGLIVLTWIFKIIVDFATIRIFGAPKGGDRLISYLSPTILLIAVAMLELFSRIKFYKEPHIITFLAPISFGVYLIHVHPMIWNELMLGAFKSFATYNPVLLVLAVIGSALAIYLVCSLIDYLRLLLFKLCKIKRILSRFENKMAERFKERGNK